jgi:uncharacterized protein YbjQ (UPF0145 family)
MPAAPFSMLRFREACVTAGTDDGRSAAGGLCAPAPRLWCGPASDKFLERPPALPGGPRTSGVHSEERSTRMLVVTTPSIEGKRITRYLGLVSGDAIMGANIFRDLFASIRDIVGGRSAAYEKELRKAKQIALEEMMQEAAQLGANAVVGVDLDYETIEMGQGGGMLMVSANGTAVVYE